MQKGFETCDWFAGADGNGRITILVSHRFSTVRMADLIIVLDGSPGADEDVHLKRTVCASLAYYVVTRGSDGMPVTG